MPPEVLPFSLEFEFRNKRYKSAEVGLDAFAKALGTVPGMATNALRSELKDFLDTVAEAMAQRHSKPWPGGTSPTTLAVRSGGAGQSIRDSVRVDGHSLKDVAGFIGGKFWLKTHEYGATIKVKNAKYLTIPLRAALSAQGVPLKQKAKDWPNTFIAKSKKGNLIIFQRRGADIVPLYVLKREVKIPKRLGLGDTLRAGLPYFVDKSMAAMVKAIREVP